MKNLYTTPAWFTRGAKTRPARVMYLCPSCMQQSRVQPGVVIKSQATFTCQHCGAHAHVVALAGGKGKQ